MSASQTPPQTARTPMFTRQQVVILFVAAVVLRLAYLAVVVALDGNINNGSDSGKFLQLASNINQFGSLVNWDLGVFGRDTGRMPLYPYLLAGIFSLVGAQQLWVVAVIQAFVDAGTVFAVGLLAGAIDRRWALPAAILTCGWTSLIVLTSFVLADTVFMALFCWGLCACVWATRSRHTVLLIFAAGLAFSLALLTRPTLMFFPYFLVPALALLLWVCGGQSWQRAIVLALVPAFMMVLAVVPRAAENHAEFGKPVVTTQSGNHALDVVDQFIRLCSSCVASDMEARMHAEVQARLKAQTREDQQNPTVLDGVRREIAIAYLKQIPVGVLIKGTILGAARSTLQSGIYETGHQFELNPQFLSAIPGASFPARVATFAKTVATDGFLTIWAVAQIVTILAFAMQAVGVLTGLRTRESRPYIIFLLGVAAYFLALNGPFGNPRYGITLTPVLIVLTAAGITALMFRYLRPRAEAKP